MDISSTQKRIDIMERLQQEIKVAKDALKQELENSMEYMESVAETKEAMTKKKRLKEQVFAQEECQKLLEHIKDNTQEISTINEILAQELMEHYQSNGTNEIEDGQGETRKFVLTVKLLPKRAGKDKFESTSWNRSDQE